MAEIEGFDNIVSCLTLAKELHDIDRDDVVGQFYDVLSWDSYYENIVEIISSIFGGYYCDYNEEKEFEIMEFSDDVISNYFTHAWEYGKHHNLHYSQNPYIPQARNKITACFRGSCCIDWKLLSYIRTKKAAQKSSLLIHMYKVANIVKTILKPYKRKRNSSLRVIISFLVLV